MLKPYFLMLYDSVALGFFMYLSIFLSFYTREHLKRPFFKFYIIIYLKLKI